MNTTELPSKSDSLLYITQRDRIVSGLVSITVFIKPSSVTKKTSYYSCLSAYSDLLVIRINTTHCNQSKFLKHAQQVNSSYSLCVKCQNRNKPQNIGDLMILCVTKVGYVKSFYHTSVLLKYAHRYLMQHEEMHWIILPFLKPTFKARHMYFMYSLSDLYFMSVLRVTSFLLVSVCIQCLFYLAHHITSAPKIIVRLRMYVCVHYYVNQYWLLMPL